VSETFGQRLRRLRTEQGFTVVALAAIARTAEGTIRHLEAGDAKTPSLLLGVRLADALHVEVRFLALGEGSTVAQRFDALERRLDKLERRAAQTPHRP
jgi:transcriptional regulator with XRE-family HTH domain